MGFLDKLTGLVPSTDEIAKTIKSNASELLSTVVDGVAEATEDLTKGKIKLTDTAKKDQPAVSNKDNSKQEKNVPVPQKTQVVVKCDKENMSDQEKASTMLKIMDWAYEKSNSNIPGLGTSEDMAKDYLKKCNGDVTKAVDSLIRWQTTYAGTAGFLSSFGGFTTLVVTLPANIASVMAIQLRMIGAISYMTGEDLLDEERKTTSYVCLLGAEAANVLANVGSEFAVKFATHSLKNLSGAALTRINQAVGFRLFTKFGEKGLINLHKLIPILGGVVGASIDAFSTYGMAQAAKAIFLKDVIDKERAEDLEVLRFKILVNMALVDGIYENKEKEMLKFLLSGVSLSAPKMKIINDLLENPKKSEIDWTPYKGDVMLSACLLETLNQVIFADGKYSMAEKIYFKQIAKELGYTEDDLKDIIG